MRDYPEMEETRRARRRLEQQGALDRQQRLQITMGVGAAVMLLLGMGAGFALGRVTAPKPKATPVKAETTLPSGVVEEVATETIDPDFEITEEPTASVEATEAPAVPDTPKQLAPANGSTVSGSRVYLKWSKVDDTGTGIEYAFEIQDRRSNGTWGRKQVITGLTSTSYSARVLSVRRRWRVWAVDGEGNKSKTSGWRTYTGKAAKATPSKPSTSSASDETT